MIIINIRSVRVEILLGVKIETIIDQCNIEILGKKYFSEG